MKVFQKILVAIDFGDASLEALAKAATLAKLSGASLQIVHVVDDIAGRYLEFPFSAVGHLQTGVTESAEQQLCELVQRDDLRYLRPRPLVLTSANPADAIVHQAEEEGVDLIVMGTHGRPPMVRLLLGSVAERVVRAAVCPVLVVHAPVSPAHLDLNADKTVMPIHA